MVFLTQLLYHGNQPFADLSLAAVFGWDGVARSVEFGGQVFIAQSFLESLCTRVF